MGLNTTPTGDRIHIGFFGRRNAGKSSLINAVTGQQAAIVSDTKGTTTDPVYKAMELLPLGPVMLIDTPGLDDTGDLGALRVQKTKQVLNKVDLAVLVIDGTQGYMEEDEQLLALLQAKRIPALVAVNKVDAATGALPGRYENEIGVSAQTAYHIDLLKQAITAAAPQEKAEHPIIRDLVQPGATVVLVTPIDSAAPKGRLILPQQQTIRDLLDAGCTCAVCQTEQLAATLASFRTPPAMVVTDSQAFGPVSQNTPKNIPLTSFSILFARHKGNLEQVVQGVAQLDALKDGDCVLIAEGCSHHRQCDDIGTVKLPKWMKDYTKKDLRFAFTSGGDFPDDLTLYQLVVHCGGCMLNEREMKYRLRCAADQQVPITNYGTLIAQIHGVLKRSLAPFPSISAFLRS